MGWLAILICFAFIMAFVIPYEKREAAQEERKQAQREQLAKLYREQEAKEDRLAMLKQKYERLIRKHGSYDEDTTEERVQLETKIEITERDLSRLTDELEAMRSKVWWGEYTDDF